MCLPVGVESASSLDALDAIQPSCVLSGQAVPGFDVYSVCLLESIGYTDVLPSDVIDGTVVPGTLLFG